MVKKISAIVLALVLCLSAMVVPVSALELGDAKIAYEIKFDKEYYSPSDTVTVSLYIHGETDLEFAAGAIVFGCHSDLFDTATNTAANVKASSTMEEVAATYYKDVNGQTWAWQTNATIYNNIVSSNTAEENELFDQYIKVGINKLGSNGSHELAADATRGYPANDLNANNAEGIPFITFQLVLRDDIPDGTVINVGVPTGTMPKSYTYLNYLNDPGNSNKVTKTTAADSDVVFAKATIGEDPCKDGHASTTASEEVITPETCTVDGLKKVTYTCDVCGKVDRTEDVTIPAAHKYDAVVTAPTCTGDGYTIYTCSVCGDYYTSDVVTALGHTAAEAVVENEVAATCKDDGSYDSAVYCSVCDVELSRETVAVPATGAHVYATVVDEKAATCTEDGYVTKACGCGERETTVVPATGHTAAEAVVENEVAATCTADGSYDTVVYCSVCDAELSRVPATVPATGHTEAEAVVENEVVADCTNDGSYDTVVYCSVCNEELSRDTTTITAEGHKYGTEVTAPTCTEAGYTTYTCSVCGDTYTDDEVDALGHDYETAVTEPTCTDAGYTTYTCSVCGDTYTADEVEAVGHSYTDEVLRTATCTRTGVIKYTCSVCGDNYREDIPSIDHKNADGSPATVVVPGKPATCTSTGLTDGEKCTLCQNMTVVQQTIPTTDHGKDNAVVTKPTYSSQGYTTYTCNTCGATYDADYVPALSVDFTFEIAAPSVTTLRARDTIILHPVFEGEVAEGVTVEWTVDNENFEIVEVYEDGSVKVEAKKVVRGTDGITTFTATVVDADGNEITSDTVELTANAKFLQRLAGFFRVLFKRAANYEK